MSSSLCRKVWLHLRFSVHHSPRNYLFRNTVTQQSSGRQNGDSITNPPVIVSIHSDDPCWTMLALCSLSLQASSSVVMDQRTNFERTGTWPRLRQDRLSESPLGVGTKECPAATSLKRNLFQNSVPLSSASSTTLASGSKREAISLVVQVPID